MRDRADGVAAAGAVCVVSGLGLKLGVWAALVAAGAFLLAAAVLMGRAAAARPPAAPVP